jgi:hypothetical protein
LVAASSPPAKQPPLAITNTDRPTQPLPVRQPPTAIERAADKGPFPKPAIDHKSRFRSQPRQNVAISPSGITDINTDIPEVTDRSNRVVSALTNPPKETGEREINTVEDTQDTAALETKTDRTPSEPVAPQPLAQKNTPITLDDEMRLLKAAYSALRAGKPEQALAQLAEHTWRFPNGELAESRDVAHIMALCRAGKVEASRSEAKRFLSERPSSPFAGRVRAICTKRTKTSP